MAPISTPDFASLPATISHDSRTQPITERDCRGPPPWCYAYGPNGRRGGLGPGSIAAIVLGVFLFLALVLCAYLCMVASRRRTAGRSSTPSSYYYTDTASYTIPSATRARGGGFPEYDGHAANTGAAAYYYAPGGGGSTSPSSESSRTAAASEKSRPGRKKTKGSRGGSTRSSSRAAVVSGVKKAKTKQGRHSK